MYSYVIEFNLAKRGDDAEEYLADAARNWPELWASLPGVTGTLLLSSALALGGEFEYQWRVDIDSFATLARVDEAMKSERRWRKSRTEWFKHRTAARARVAKHLGGNEAYSREYSTEKSGAIHYVHQAAPGESGNAVDLVERLRTVSGVLDVQAVGALAGGAPAEHTWVRLESIQSLDAVAAADLGAGTGRLYGELREVDGALFAGA